MAAINQSQQQQYCLKWNSFHTNITDGFQNMLIHENLVDVTLTCEGASIKAHKMILAVCSPYFQNLFMSNPCKHPIVFLSDVKFNDLKAIIDFIYSGEVNIPQNQLNSVLKTAEALKIKGLADFGEKQTMMNNNNNINSNSMAIRNSTPLNYFGKKRKFSRPQFNPHGTNNNNLLTSAINNSPHSQKIFKINPIHHHQQQQHHQLQVQQQQKEMTNGNVGENGAGGDSSDDEGNNSSKSASIDKNYHYTNSNVNSPNNFNNNNNNSNKNQNSNSIPQQTQQMYVRDDRDDSEEFEPTKLLEQSMSTPENTGVDYSPENNTGDVQSGDDDEAEESKVFMDDEYSSNNSNTDMSLLPVGINNFADQFVTTAANNNNNNNNNGVNGANSRTIEGNNDDTNNNNNQQTLKMIVDDNSKVSSNIVRSMLLKPTSSSKTLEYETLLAEIQQKNLTTCPVCSKEFIKKSKLIRHYHTHFSDFRPKFSCVFCGKLFTTQDWCKRHALNCQLKHYQHMSQLDIYND